MTSTSSPPPCYSETANVGEIVLPNETIVPPNTPMPTAEKQFFPPTQSAPQLAAQPPQPAPQALQLAPPAPIVTNPAMYPTHMPAMGYQMMPYQPAPMYYPGPMMPTAIPMQCMPMQPQAPAGGTNVNVVVNNDQLGGFGSSGHPTICPKCRKGVIIRVQSRMRMWIILLISLLTCWFLFCIPCICLRWNYVDTCAYCKKVYGHRGVKKQKKQKR